LSEKLSYIFPDARDARDPKPNQTKFYIEIGRINGVGGMMKNMLVLCTSVKY